MSHQYNVSYGVQQNFRWCRGVLPRRRDDAFSEHVRKRWCDETDGLRTAINWKGFYPEECRWVALTAARVVVSGEPVRGLACMGSLVLMAFKTILTNEGNTAERTVGRQESSAAWCISFHSTKERTCPILPVPQRGEYVNSGDSEPIVLLVRTYPERQDFGNDFGLRESRRE